MYSKTIRFLLLLIFSLLAPRIISNGRTIAEPLCEPKIIVWEPEGNNHTVTGEGIVLVNKTSPQIEVSISPGITTIFVTVDNFDNRKWAAYLYLNATPTNIGWYRLVIHFNFCNPSTWRQSVENSHFVLFIPYNMVKLETINHTGSPADRLVDRKKLMEDAMIYIIEFEITGSGYILFYIVSHAVIADVNGDGIVDISDIYLVALNYRKTYGSTDDPLYIYDMNVDFMIDITDISYVARVQFQVIS